MFSDSDLQRLQVYNMYLLDWKGMNGPKVKTHIHI